MPTCHNCAITIKIIFRLKYWENAVAVHSNELTKFICQWTLNRMNNDWLPVKAKLIIETMTEILHNDWRFDMIDIRVTSQTKTFINVNTKTVVVIHSFIQSFIYSFILVNREWNRRCWLQNEGDRDSLYEVRYFPNKGFAFKYYPYYNQPHYLPPIVFVQFDTPKEGTLIQAGKQVSLCVFDHQRCGVFRSCQMITFETLVVENSYLHIRYIFREYRSTSYMKVIGSKSRSQEQQW